MIRLQSMLTTFMAKAALAGLAALLMGFASACSAPGYPFFGVATLDHAGTLCLQLRTEEPGRPVAEGYFCYKTTDPAYQAIKDHVGPIKAGEQKAIEPFD